MRRLHQEHSSQALLSPHGQNDRDASSATRSCVRGMIQGYPFTGPSPRANPPIYPSSLPLTWKKLISKVGGHLWSMYFRRSLDGRLVTQNFDRVVPFELDESTKINMTKLWIHPLNFEGRIFAKTMTSNVFGNILPVFQRSRCDRLIVVLVHNFINNRTLCHDTWVLMFACFCVWFLERKN